MGKIFGALIAAVFGNDCVRATKYMSEKYVIKATRRRYKGRIIKGNVEIILTAGRPNYAERKFINQAKKAGEPFPIKKIRLKVLK